MLSRIKHDRQASKDMLMALSNCVARSRKGGDGSEAGLADNVPAVLCEHLFPLPNGPHLFWAPSGLSSRLGRALSNACEMPPCE